jgi:uncharacterized protein YggE
MTSTLATSSKARLGLRLGAIGLGLVLAAAAALPAQAQERMSRILSVTGRGSEILTASTARVTLGVEARANTAEAAQAEMAKRTSAVVNLLKSRNVQKLQTTGVYLSPYYDNNSKPIGFMATNTVSFEVSAAEAGALMDAAVKVGATRVDGVQFTIDEATSNMARNRALAAATRDAQAQADAVLTALGLSRQEIIGIQVEGAAMPMPAPMLRGVASAAAETPVVAGEQTVQATVTLHIRY